MTTSEPTERQKRIAARAENLRSRLPHVPIVLVEPTSDEYRKFIKHPNGTRFPESGAAKWPLDQFTQRRIKDGSVKVVDARAHAHAHRRVRHGDHGGEAA